METALPVVDSVSDYEKIKRIGEGMAHKHVACHVYSLCYPPQMISFVSVGTYGVVYKARDRNSGEIVALKKLRMDRERDGEHLPPYARLRCIYGLKKFSKLLTKHPYGGYCRHARHVSARVARPAELQVNFLWNACSIKTRAA